MGLAALAPSSTTERASTLSSYHTFMPVQPVKTPPTIEDGAGEGYETPPHLISVHSRIHCWSLLLDA